MSPTPDHGNGEAPARPDRSGRFAALLRGGAVAPRSVPPPCAVRVLSGLHAGACVRLRASPVRIGSAGDNDIVLNDAGVQAHHAELRRTDGQWALYIGSGPCAFPPLERRRRGRMQRERHGIGGCDVVVSQPRPPVRPPSPLRWQRFVAPGLLAAAALLATAAVLQLTQPATAQVASGRESLAAHGWPDATIVREPDRRPSVQGHVHDAQQQAALKRWLLGQGLVDAELATHVGSEWVERVRDALEGSGLAVAYIGAGQVRVTGATADAATRTALSRLRADIAGAVELVDHVGFIETPQPPRLRPLPARITSLTPGELGSFSTEGGARYFVGSVMSDGAQVVAISASGIEFRLGDKTILHPLN